MWFASDYPYVLSKNTDSKVNFLHLKFGFQGASTTCYVALSQRTNGMSGKYFVDCNESYCSSLANDESAARELWKQTRVLIHTRLRQPAT